MRVKKNYLWLLASVVLVSIVVIGVYFNNDQTEVWLSENTEEQSIDIDSLIHAQPEILHGMDVKNCDVIEGTIRPNQRFVDLISDYTVSSHVMAQLHTVPRKLFNFQTIKSNQKYSLVVERDSLRNLRALVYEPNKQNFVLFHFQDSLIIEKCERNVHIRERMVTGTIQSSLWETLEAMEVPAASDLTNAFVDVFDWKVNFYGLQLGDQFKIIYNEVALDDEVIGIESIVAVGFQHQGVSLFGFGYDQGNGWEYFDEQGNSCQSQLLRYPIQFTRISSRYSRRRFHPVAKVYRPHLGTDFAAPRGTPIRSAGDGVIVEAKYKRNNGNYVKIRHNSSYTTGYLHMSKIAKGIRSGVRVKKGQTIGYVGSTGLATGPHLCYRFWRNGKQVDALKVKIPLKDKIKPTLKEGYQQRVDSLKKKVDFSLNS